MGNCSRLRKSKKFSKAAFPLIQNTSQLKHLSGKNELKGENKSNNKMYLIPVLLVLFQGAVVSKRLGHGCYFAP